MTVPVELSFNFDFDRFKFDARRDTLDFRDQMYNPSLVEVPRYIDLEEYKRVGVPILSQGSEGACTGFGLATVANFLLRTRKVTQDTIDVSPRMFYEMAKKYDEYPGERYSGSSARGAMKGWHKHGICADECWRYVAGGTDLALTRERADDARKRPLGAYYRVNHKDLICMHTSLADVRILYATANVHDGWRQPNKVTGTIEYRPDTPEAQVRGAHAFAIVAYDQEGFWIQNSWSANWGKGGFARITYDDWLANGLDVWVARLGVPVNRLAEKTTAISNSPGANPSTAYSYDELRPHIISLSNDGQLSDRGVYGTTKEEIVKIFKEDIPQLTNGWDKRRILLYAHGGLVGEKGFLQRVAEYRSAFMQCQVYPIAFIWHTDLWNTLTDMLQDASSQRRPEGILDATLDFMLDRLDDTLESIVRGLRVRSLWDEMKENAWLATARKEGGARFVMDQLSRLMDKFPGEVEVHVVAHSAGAIFHAPLVQYFTGNGPITMQHRSTNRSVILKERAIGRGKNITSCTLWAPALRIAEFKETYLPAIQDRRMEHFSLFTLTDDAEQCDNVARIYNKSLLYLVSKALEESTNEPMLGLEKSITRDADLITLFKDTNADWVRTPIEELLPQINISKARQHGDFDDDPDTLRSTLARIIPQDKLPPPSIFQFKRSSASNFDQRQNLQRSMERDWHPLGRL